MKKLTILMLSAAILFAQSSFAARVGGGRSMGMQRSAAPRSNSTYTSPTSAAPSNVGTQPTRSGPGMGTVVAGAAAGAVGGYLLGKSMNSEKGNSSQTMSSSATNESNIPWGIIAILGMLLVIGMMIFRRKTAAAAANQGNLGGIQPGNGNFTIPNIRRDNSSFTANQPAQTVGGGSAYTNPALERMADGVEAQYFLRQAKGMFLHIQSMNSSENVAEVEKYMTPDLYTEIKQSITANDYLADFSQLDCQLLQSAAENGNFIASVKFFGKVSESPSMPAVDFNEIWNFVKPAGNENAKWLVAGIQQASVN